MDAVLLLEPKLSRNKLGPPFLLCRGGPVLAVSSQGFCVGPLRLTLSFSAPPPASPCACCPPDGHRQAFVLVSCSTRFLRRNSLVHVAIYHFASPSRLLGLVVDGALPDAEVVTEHRTLRTRVREYMSPDIAIFISATGEVQLGKTLVLIPCAAFQPQNPEPVVTARKSSGPQRVRSILTHVIQ